MVCLGIDSPPVFQIHAVISVSYALGNGGAKSATLKECLVSISECCPSLSYELIVVKDANFGVVASDESVEVGEVVRLELMRGETFDRRHRLLSLPRLEKSIVCEGL